MVQQPSSVIERWLAAGDRGDVEAFDDLLHEDVVVHAPAGLSTDSREAEKQVWRDAVAAVPDLRHAVQEILVVGDTEMARVEVTGTLQGDFGGARGTGRTFHIDQAVVCHLREGRVAEAWEIADIAALVHQTGRPRSGPSRNARRKVATTMDLFAGVAVSDLRRAIGWFDRLFGDVESFEPNDTEHVWTLADHCHVYVELQPTHAGHAKLTLFVDDLDGFLEAAAGHGLEPHTQETYDNGVRKAVYRDPDGNEIGIGGTLADRPVTKQ